MVETFAGDDGDSDAFDLDSLDEVDLLIAVQRSESSQGQLKRKEYPISQNPPAKRTALSSVRRDEIVYSTQCALATQSLNAIFGLPSFRLRQEAVISRIVAGGSAVVVFPTGP